MMKYLIALIVLAVSAVSTVSAASGSTSTGSTSTGSTSTGVTVQVSHAGAGGVIRGFNMTTQSFDLVPQCFPYVWIVEFYKGNFFDLYINQNKCRAQRFIDFGV